jgi:hypothetical protein
MSDVLKEELEVSPLNPLCTGSNDTDIQVLESIYPTEVQSVFSSDQLPDMLNPCQLRKKNPKPTLKLTQKETMSQMAHLTVRVSDEIGILLMSLRSQSDTGRALPTCIP